MNRSFRAVTLQCSIVVLASSLETLALAAGDFPVASCKSWNGTVVEREGIDSAKASMRGIVPHPSGLVRPVAKRGGSPCWWPASAT